jgi:hypothetical protein
MKLKPLKIGVDQRCAVTFTREIISQDGRLVRRFKPQKNLLLDQGLNNLGTGTVSGWANAFSYCVLGSGTTPTRRDSGTITFSRSGTAVTASANFFEAADSGRLLKFDSGEECYLTYVNGTTATSNISGTVAAAEGTIHYVNVTSHQTELKRTSAYASDSGANGSSWNGTTGILSQWRTFLFSAETGSVTYREIGWSHSVTAGANLSGRALIAGGGDSLIAGQIYKVKVQFDITLTPLTAVAFVVPTGIWAGATGQTRIEGVNFGLVQTTGNVGSMGHLDPAHTGLVFLATGSTALAAPSLVGPLVSGQVGSQYGLTLDSYSAGSFTRTSRATVPVNDANVATIRSVQFAGMNSAGQGSLRLLFDAAQTKTSSQTLLIVFRKTWGRVLVN